MADRGSGRSVRRARIVRLVVNLILVIVACQIISLAARLIEFPVDTWLPRVPPGNLILTLFGLGCAALATVIVTHEAGHLLAGWLGGFRVHSLVIGPLQMENGENGFQISINLLQPVRGLTSLVPVGEDRLVWRLTWVVLGGLVANLLVALLSAGGFVAVLAADASPSLRIGFGLTALVASSTLIASLIPHRTGGMDTDGLRLLTLLRNDARTERVLVSNIALSQVFSGTRPRALDGEALARAAAIRDSTPLELSAVSLAYVHTLDQGTPAHAESHLRRMIELERLFTPPNRLELYAEAAYFEARWLGQAEAARTWIERVPQTQQAHTKTFKRGLAATLIAEGHSGAALALLDEVLAAPLPRRPYGTTLAEREWLVDLRGLCAGESTIREAE